MVQSGGSFTGASSPRRAPRGHCPRALPAVMAQWTGLKVLVDWIDLPVSGKRGSLSSAMRWRAAPAVCALFAPATSCATSPPCVGLVPSRPVTSRPPMLPTTDDPNDPFNICVTTPDAPQCYDPRAPGASPRCDGRTGCGPDPTPRFDRCYREGGQRKPLRVSTSRYSPRPGGACEYDGECRVGGCKDLWHLLSAAFLRLPVRDESSPVRSSSAESPRPHRSALWLRRRAVHVLLPVTARCRGSTPLARRRSPIGCFGRPCSSCTRIRSLARRHAT